MKFIHPDQRLGLMFGPVTTKIALDAMLVTSFAMLVSLRSADAFLAAFYFGVGMLLFTISTRGTTDGKYCFIAGMIASGSYMLTHSTHPILVDIPVDLRAVIEVLPLACIFSSFAIITLLLPHEKLKLVITTLLVPTVALAAAFFFFDRDSQEMVEVQSIAWLFVCAWIIAIIPVRIRASLDRLLGKNFAFLESPKPASAMDDIQPENKQAAPGRAKPFRNRSTKRKQK